MSEPTFFYAPGTGILSSRSDWTTGAVQVLFRAGATRESHEDRSQSEFLISRDNQWLAGMAKLQSHSGISQDAIDHNCVTVDSKSQVWTQDGVSILRQESNDQYTYAMADLTAAYNGQLSVFIREILFLKPNFLLIADGYLPVNANSQVVFHLNTPNAPSQAGGTFHAGPLFGAVIEPSPPVVSSTSVKLAPEQTTPTYRVDVAGDGRGHFLVALEAAPAGQAASTMGNPVTTADVQGIRCGTAFVGWLAGNQAAWVYPSPAPGLHILIGTPNTVYQTPGGSITSSAVGVLVFSGPPVGQPVIINKGGTPPPPPPPPPPRGRTFNLFIPASGVPVITEVPSGS